MLANVSHPLLASSHSALLMFYYITNLQTRLRGATLHGDAAWRWDIDEESSDATEIVEDRFGV